MAKVMLTARIEEEDEEFLKDLGDGDRTQGLRILITQARAARPAQPAVRRAAPPSRPAPVRAAPKPAPAPVKKAGIAYSPMSGRLKFVGRPK